MGEGQHRATSYFVQHGQYDNKKADGQRKCLGFQGPPVAPAALHVPGKGERLAVCNHSVECLDLRVLRVTCPVRKVELPRLKNLDWFG